MFFLSMGYIGGRYPRGTEYSFGDGLKAGAIAERAMLLFNKQRPSEQIAAILDYSECHVRLRPEVRLYLQITRSEILTSCMRLRWHHSAENRKAGIRMVPATIKKER